MSKLFVKLRESGGVIRVERCERNMVTGEYEVNFQYIIGENCDLCDEQGRLLKPEDGRLREATKLLQDLADLQNGAPLEQHRAEWEDVMDRVYKYLDKEEQK